MTQAELTQMKAWLVQHAKDYLVYTSAGKVIANKKLEADFYEHFKPEIL